MTRILLALGLLAALTGAAAEPSRRDAVFILGEDTADAGSFYAPATAYYKERMRSDTDLLVVGARSLQEAREWLVRSHKSDDPPWGRIILVAHGSPWVGLAVPLYADGTRADLPDLERALQRGEFPALPRSMFDTRTRLLIESCGVGRRVDLLDLYARLFGGADANRRVVEASYNWIEFGQTVDADGGARNWRSERLFEAQVAPRAELDATREERIRKQLTARLSEAAGETSFAGELTWRTAPVRIELAITDNTACRSDRAVRRLSSHASVIDKLRAYGLDRGDLAWHVDAATSGCTLVGQGTLAVLGQGSLLGELLPE
ncbi:hypothetical protein [Dokdonella sp.]|uniref:hypothetical protein n=1 Tax=Dokdonella sp. TaxID=2291710 RepID=UPI00352988E5